MLRVEPFGNGEVDQTWLNHDPVRRRSAFSQIKARSAEATLGLKLWDSNRTWSQSLKDKARKARTTGAYICT